MERGRELSELKVREFWFYKGSEKSKRGICEIFISSKTANHNVLRKIDFSRKYKKSSRKRKLSTRDNRRIFKLQTKQNLSTRKIPQKTRKIISHTAVWLILRSNSIVALRKFKKNKTKLLKHHKEERRKWARSHDLGCCLEKYYFFQRKKK